MPNWCEGSLKVRGKVSDLKQFVLKGLRPVTLMGDNAGSLSFEDEDDTSFFIQCSKDSLYLEGSRRHFCEPDYIEVYADDAETPTIMILPMKAAWSIDPEALVSLSKTFNVDLKIQGFEYGMQFSQIIAVVGGKLIQNQEIKYDDWDWDCPCPRMGG